MTSCLTWGTPSHHLLSSPTTGHHHISTMDERIPKRPRQRGSGEFNEGRYGAGNSTRGASSSNQPVLTGCHMDVKPSLSHLFPGYPIDVEVRLLNDEDAVQHKTVDKLDVTIIGEDGKALETHPKKFELTPLQPAVLDGTSTFQLTLREGSVRTGSRIRVHVEAFSMGTLVKADSEPLMVCRSALAVVTQPPENWYKDEGGKNNCIEIVAQVRDKATGRAQPGVPLNLALIYETGTEVQSQEILQVQADTQLFTNESGRANLKFKITEVSLRHQSQKFRVKISPDVKTSPNVGDVAPSVTVPVMVLSKRKNKKSKEQRMGHASHTSPYTQNTPISGMYPMAAVAKQHELHRQQHGQLTLGVMPGSTIPPVNWQPPTSAPLIQSPSMQKPQQQQHISPHMPSGAPPHRVRPPQGCEGEASLRLPLGSVGALHDVFKWTEAVLSLLQMELQWEHIGYEVEDDGTASYTRPLWRCPVCRVCKGNGIPVQKHAADCRLRGLLSEYEDRTKRSFETAVRDQERGLAAIAAAAASGRVQDGGRGAGRSVAGSRCGVPPRDGFTGSNGASRSPDFGRGPLSAISSLGGIPLDRHYGQDRGGMPGDSERRPGDGSASAVRGLPGSASELLPPSSSGGGSLGSFLTMDPTFSANNYLVPRSGSSDGVGASMRRTGSVAPFLPLRKPLTPAEEKAHYIMLPASEGGAQASVGAGADSNQLGNHLTVFSDGWKLLGFYEETWEAEQTHLLFHDMEEGSVAPAVASALEKRLVKALDDDSNVVNAGAAGTGGGGSSASGDAMETDDNAHGRHAAGRKAVAAAGGKPSVRSSSTGVKKEPLTPEGGPGRGKVAAGALRRVYMRRDFKSYQEMKEQAFIAWKMQAVDAEGVF